MDDAAAILERARDGARLELDEVQRLLEQGEILQLGAVAAQLSRRRTEPGVATYLIDRHIAHTSVCRYRCRLCTRATAPVQGSARELTPEQIVAQVAETIASGGTGIRLGGGLNPELGLDWYEALLRLVRDTFPHLHLQALSAPEITDLSDREGLPISLVLARLREAGLGSLPGGGAEILDDEIRRTVSPAGRLPARSWLAVHREAHRQGLPTEAAMVLGLGETARARAQHLVRLRQVQDETGGFVAFCLWSFQDAGTELEGALEPINAVDYLRVLAVSRITLDAIDHVQASWETQGEDVAQLALHFGADDLGSLRLEEGAGDAPGASFRMDQARIERLIRGAGLIPRQRRTLFERV